MLRRYIIYTPSDSYINNLLYDWRRYDFSFTV